MASFTNALALYKLYIQVDDDDLKKKYEDSITDRVSNNSTDSGFDLFLPDKVTYEPGTYTMFDHKVKCKMVIETSNDEIPTGYLLHPRSSTAKKYDLMMGNNTGVIDQDYRGNIMACMFCNWTKADLMHSSNTHWCYSSQNRLDQYTRIVQICAPNYRPFKVEIVDSLDETSRGSGGFGSTGN